MDLIAAVSANMGIGMAGKVPWRLPLEYAYFQRMTTATGDPSKVSKYARVWFFFMNSPVTFDVKSSKCFRPRRAVRFDCTGARSNPTARRGGKHLEFFPKFPISKVTGLRRFRWVRVSDVLVVLEQCATNGTGHVGRDSCVSAPAEGSLQRCR